MWCVIGGSSDHCLEPGANTPVLVSRALDLACSSPLSGLRIYLIYGNFRTLDMWDELGFSRTYLNWGYTVADGTAVAMVIGLFSRFMSLKQLASSAALWFARRSCWSAARAVRFWALAWPVWS